MLSEVCTFKRVLIEQRTPQQVAHERAKFNRVRKDFIECAMDEIFENYDGRERVRIFRKAATAQCHHVHPISLGGHPTWYENVVLCERDLHGEIHKTIDNRRSNDVAYLPTYAGKIWIPS